jgi:hypothetical protein
VSRTTPEGDPDLAFGVDGVTASIEDLPSASAVAVAVLPDDKIIAVGMLDTGSFSMSGFVVVRYHANGSLDEEFGEGGVGISATFEGPNEFAVWRSGRAAASWSPRAERCRPGRAKIRPAVFDAQGNRTRRSAIRSWTSGVLRDGRPADDRIVIILGGPAFFDFGSSFVTIPTAASTRSSGVMGVEVPDLGPDTDTFSELSSSLTASSSSSAPRA